MKNTTVELSSSSNPPGRVRYLFLNSSCKKIMFSILFRGSNVPACLNMMGRSLEIILVGVGVTQGDLDHLSSSMSHLTFPVVSLEVFIIKLPACCHWLLRLAHQLMKWGIQMGLSDNKMSPQMASVLFSLETLWHNSIRAAEADGAVNGTFLSDL